METCTVNVPDPEVVEEEEEPELTIENRVLDPNHPLLEKFQQALKKHLSFQINRMKDEIFELETEAKKKEVEREELGVQTYELQQQVCNKQKVLENIIDELQTVSAAKEQVDVELEECKKNCKDLEERYVEREKENRDLQNEIESINLLNYQMAKWEENVESQISINKRKLSKSKQDQLNAIKEKQKQDILIYKLQNLIWKLEGEIETLALQISLKEREIENLEESVTLGNTNIEAIQAEIRCLMHSWNSVVVAISNRDKSVDCFKEEYNKLMEQLKSITAEIEQVKKLIKREQVENEKLTMLKTRIQLDIKNCTIQMEEEMSKKNKIEREMYTIQEISEQTERDIESCKHENHQINFVLAALSKKFDKRANKKIELEEKLLKDLEDQMASDKVSKNLSKLLFKVKKQTREAELIMNEAENKKSLLASEIQVQKFSNEESTRLLNEIIKQKNDLHKEADLLQAEKERYELLLKKREREVEVLMAKLEFSADKNESPVCVQDYKLLELEKHLQETQEGIKQLQIFWLREQKNLLIVSQERQEQIHNINILKKQILILEQKNLKINFDLETIKKKQEKVINNINNLHNKGVILCETIFKKRNQKNNLDRSNILVQTQYDTRLKDTELEILQIEADIVEIEEDKVNLSKELVEVNREGLEWEKKFLLTKEAVSCVKKEKGSEGELSHMKLEIHKMEVIYSQMKKAQEKLLKDLTHSISRRDGIYYSSEARSIKQAAEKTKQPTEDRTRVNYLRKMDNIRNKIKQTNDELKDTEEKIKYVEEQKQKTIDDIKKTKDEQKVFENYSLSLVETVESTKTNRQFNFELLLVQQRKLTMYNDLLLNRTPFRLYKREEQLFTEYSKQKKLNDCLESLIEELKVQFPQQQHEFCRMINSLKIGALSLFA